MIRDDDQPPAVSVSDAAGYETVGELAFAVTLDGPSALQVSVGYATADGTATAGEDYEAASGMLTFAPGETAKTIRVVVLDDGLDETDEETFAVTLSEPSGAILGTDTATGVIRDDDEPPAVSVSDAAGDETVGELAFAVTLDAAAAVEVALGYATADGTALAGSDYEAASGTLTFAPGETAKTIRVVVLDDGLDEADEETFAVTLSEPSGAILGTDTATGVIRDDDQPPAVSVSDAAGYETVGELAFAVTLDGPSALQVSVGYATADGTATAGEDYEAASGMLTFAPGEVSRTVRVTVIDDAADEPDEETFVLALAAADGAMVADGEATGTIRDDDLAPPSAIGGLPAAALCVGGVAFELDLADHFDGEDLRFSAVSSAPGVATAAVSGSRLTVAPVAEGGATVAVTAANDAGTAENTLAVRVVSDPAELRAVGSVLASIGRGVLAGVAESIGERIAERGGSVGRGAATPAMAARRDPVPGAVDWNPAHAGTATVAGPGRGAVVRMWSESGPATGAGLLAGTVGAGLRSAIAGAHSAHGMAPFSFSLGGQSDTESSGSAWSVWGRGDVRRFESGHDGTSHDGTMTGVYLGADVGADDWLAGVSVLRSDAETDYRFDRTVDACGGVGVGEGRLVAELTSVHPYAARRLGRGWVWAAFGAGRGEASVERCGPGNVDEADLKVRLAALGGRHPFAYRDRLVVSVVEDVGVLGMTTGASLGPVGDRSVSVGRARLGLEAAGVAPPGCKCSLATYVRALARGDWGDGATGAGLELAAGVRYRNLPRRLGIDAGLHALAVHSAADAAERGANVTLAILPKPDGSGFRLTLTSQRGDSVRVTDRWDAWHQAEREGATGWRTQFDLGYGFLSARGLAMPFAHLIASGADTMYYRSGVRYELGAGARRFTVELSVGRHRYLHGTVDDASVRINARF